MTILQILKNKWELENQTNYKLLDDEILKFQGRYNIVLPVDMIEYLKIVNTSLDNYLDDLFVFYSVKKIKSLADEFEDWQGVPNYHKLIKNFEYANDFFVFGNYQSNLFSYAIRLKGDSNSNCEVYIFCGENYKKIANSFIEFIRLYLDDSIELYYSD